MFKEFKEFAMKGNVVDLAVGVVIGSAFGTIVNAMVADVLMPVVGVLTGGVDFSNMFAMLKAGKSAATGYATLAAAKADGAVTINYGVFLNAVVNFLIIAFALFLVVKAMNAARRREEAAPAPLPEPTPSEKLLAEIRDTLKARA
jgi:large conductance mechanosensitive channel